MWSKSQKKNKVKKLKAKQIILSVLICVLIQAAMVYAFFAFLPEKDSIDRNNLQKFTITVENVEVIGGQKRTASKVLIFADGTCYRFRDRVFGEPGPKDLVKQIQLGDTLTVFCTEDGSNYLFGQYTSDWCIYDAYSNTEVYRDIEKLNKDQERMRPFLIIVFSVFEMGFLFLVAGYCWLFFDIRGIRLKRQRRKQKEINKAKKKLGEKM